VKDEVVFKGVGYGVQFVELEDDELKDLLAQIDRSGNVLDVRRFVELYDESYYEYGLLPPSEECLTLTVNEKDNSDLLKGLISKSSDPIFPVDLTSKKNLLVYEGFEEINFSYTAAPLEECHLEVSRTSVTLPNGESHTLLTPYYKGDGFDYGDATVHGRFRIFDKDEKEIDF
jgi:hypothetical protein